MQQKNDAADAEAICFSSSGINREATMHKYRHQLSQGELFGSMRPQYLPA